MINGYMIRQGWNREEEDDGKEKEFYIISLLCQVEHKYPEMRIQFQPSGFQYVIQRVKAEGGRERTRERDTQTKQRILGEGEVILDSDLEAESSLNHLLSVCVHICETLSSLISRWWAEHMQVNI